MSEVIITKYYSSLKQKSRNLILKWTGVVLFTPDVVVFALYCIFSFLVYESTFRVEKDNEQFLFVQV